MGVDFELADYCYCITGVRKSNWSEDECGFPQFVSDDFH